MKRGFTLAWCIAETVVAAAGDDERKVALLLDQGVRADRSGAERFAADVDLQRLDLSDCMRCIELLRMYSMPLKTVGVLCFGQFRLKTTMLPMLAYLESHRRAPHPCFYPC